MSKHAHKVIMHLKAFGSQLTRGLRHFGKGPGAEPGQRCDPRIRSAWHDRSQDAIRDTPPVRRLKKRAVRRRRPATDPVDHPNLALARHAQDHRRHATQLHLFGVQHAKGNAGGHTRINGIASADKDGLGNLHRFFMARSDGKYLRRHPWHTRRQLLRVSG